MGIDRFAGDAHFHQRAARHDLLQYGKNLHREQADLDLGQAKAGGVDAHGDVAHGEDAQTTGHAVAVDAADDGHAQIGCGAHGIDRQGGRLGRVEGEYAFVGLEVAAGAEGFVAHCGEHDGTDGPVLFGHGIRPEDAIEDVGVDRIAPLGAVDGDPQCRATSINQQVFAGLLVLLCWRAHVGASLCGCG